MNTPHSKKIKIYVITSEVEFFIRNEEKIKSLANVKEICMDKNPENDQNISLILNFAEIKIPLEELADIEEIRAKTEKEIAFLKEKIEKDKKLIENADFIKKAPQSVVSSVKKALDENIAKLKKLSDN